MLEKVSVERKIRGREEILLELELDDQQNIQSSQIKAVGPLKFLQLVEEWRSKLSGPLAKVPLPEPNGAGAMILREVLMRAKGEWQAPYDQEQLCHCRSVPTAKVEEAILTGALTTGKVSRLTSASTACGTCMPDVQAMIDYFNVPTR